VDEQLDNLFLGNAGVQRDAQLAAQRLVRPERRGDRDGNECPAAVVQAWTRPRLAEGGDGCSFLSMARLR
jgi:hypothetical protein